MGIHSQVVEPEVSCGLFDAVTVGLHRSEVLVSDRAWIDGDSRFTFKAIEWSGILKIELKLLTIECLGKDHIVSAMTKSGQ